MTQKEKALQQAVEQALKDCDSFYEKGKKLNVLKISNVEFNSKNLQPEDVDDSTLERCTGGDYHGSCRLETDIDGNIKIEQNYVITVSFKVRHYDSQTNQFTARITKVTVNTGAY
ncbi:hypothetical protein [uncultured Rikenella sp.]|uniref:hypothetical protein n=1 Tax=uncultured Rikenella sp. TaxID=368003 RepID=UPI002622B7B7|nr:hypothetical protein [uncultured Rikenella sp.]